MEVKVKVLSIERLSTFLKICLRVTFVIGIFVTIFLSYILKHYFWWYFLNDQKYYLACVVIISVCGACTLNILWQLIYVMSTIQNNNPFTDKNVLCLKFISYSCFIISVLFLVLLFFRVSLFVFIISYIFIIVGLCCILLSWLFKKTVEFKTENDLTV